MVDAIPFLAIGLSLASAALFFLVGRTVQSREVSDDARSAQVAFVAWWYGIAAVSLVGAVLSLPGFPLDLRLFLAVTAVSIAVLCAALCGLTHYLVFLYTSRRGALPYLVVGYAAYFAFLLGFILRGQPTSVEATRWGPKLQSAAPIESGPLFWLAIVLLLGPPLVGAAAYLSLYWRARDPLLRRRILLVSLSILFWFGTSLFGTSAGVQEADWWILTSRLIGLAAAGTILYAYAGLRPGASHGMQPVAGEPAESLYEPPKGRASTVLPAT